MGSYRYLVNGRITRPCSSHAGSFEIPAPIEGSGSRRRTPARIGVQLMAGALERTQPIRMSLEPTTAESLRLSTGETVLVPKATPTFELWQGAEISSTYGGKAVLAFDGRPAFAELVILWSLEAEGWEGAWVTHGGGREIYRTGLMDAAPLAELPDTLGAMLGRVRALRGTSRGTWDVCCVKGTEFLFVESKRKGHDAISGHQVNWLEAALSTGLELSSFLVVEWTSDGSVRLTV
jgi:hypothetical protein